MYTILIITVLALSACSSGSSDPENTNPENFAEEDTTEVSDPAAEIIEPPQALVSRLSLNTDHYEQYLDAQGIPIISSSVVNPYALLETRWIVRNMLINRPDVVNAIASTNTRLSLMAISEFTTDIPEHADLEPADYWNRRARGLGATDARPAMSAGEENILNLPGDPYDAESILVHEFAHVIHLQGLNRLDTAFNDTLISLYNQAMNEELWAGTYAATNEREYFAEGVQSWFDTNRENDAEHNAVDTRAELFDYDPRLAALLSQVFGDNPWQYERTDVRTSSLDHLSGFDRAAAGQFSWPDNLVDVDISAEPGDVSGTEPDPSLPRLPNVLAEDWATAVSPSSTTLVTLSFYNRTTDNVIVYWVDFAGQKIQYASLSAESATSFRTYAGHLWEVQRAADEQVIARFRVEAVDSVAEIR